MAALPPPCVNVGVICATPAYAATVEYDYALHIRPPPGSPGPAGDADASLAADVTAVRRLGARISTFSGDLVVATPQDAYHRRCVLRACVVVGALQWTDTSVSVSWAPASSTSGDAYIHISVTVTADSPHALAAAVAAVFLPSDKPGYPVPLAVVLRKH